ncbi:AsmA family protein [Methylobacterium sp. A54F]
MTPRRLIPVLGLGALTAGLIAAAATPWSIETARAARFVDRGLSAYGLALGAEGATTLTLLPLPRLGFARTRIRAGADGPVLAEGGSLAIELSPWALLAGRAEVGGFLLDGADLRLGSPGDRPWAEPLRRLAARLGTDAASHPRRLALTHATVSGQDSAGRAEQARDVDVVLSWPLWSAALECGGSLTWRGAQTRFSLASLRPAELIAGAESPFVASAAWPAGSLTAEGSGRLGGQDGASLKGTGRLATRSLAETLAWLDGSVALAPFIETFSVEGRFEAGPRALMLPAVRVGVGSNVLEGAGSASFGEGRTAVQATLAAESLNLAPLLGSLMRTFDGHGAGGARPIALAPLTGGDLDLRLSAGSGRIGPVLLDDLAASVLVRGPSVEVALNRASLQGGVLKGRIALAAAAADPAETEVRAQGAFERVDLGALLIDLGQYRWVLGPSQGHFALESSGRDTAELVARIGGRAGLAIDGGAIAGLDLADVIHRNGSVAPGALARRNGRTPFERAAVSLRFADGVGEIAEGFLKAPALNAGLRGRLSLPDQRFEARAELAPRGAGGEGGRQGPLFEIGGPWDAVAVRVAPREGDGPTRGGGVLSLQPLRLPTALGVPAAARAYAP